MVAMNPHPLPHRYPAAQHGNVSGAVGDCHSSCRAGNRGRLPPVSVLPDTLVRRSPWNSSPGFRWGRRSLLPATSGYQRSGANEPRHSKTLEPIHRDNTRPCNRCTPRCILIGFLWFDWLFGLPDANFILTVACARARLRPDGGCGLIPVLRRRHLSQRNGLHKVRTRPSQGESGGARRGNRPSGW